MGGWVGGRVGRYALCINNLWCGVPRPLALMAACPLNCTRPAPPRPAPQWLCAPRGSAFLHVPARHQAHVRPLVISHGWGAGFVSEFVWTGAADYSPLLAVPAALRAWHQLGPQAVRAHQRELLGAATALLASSWGTGGLAEGCRPPAGAPCASNARGTSGAGVMCNCNKQASHQAILLWPCRLPCHFCRPACATRHVRRRHGAGAAAPGLHDGSSRRRRCRHRRGGRGRAS